MPTQTASGSQTATLDTEHTLQTITVDGTYMLYVDLSNMVAGDRVVIRAKVKIKTSGGSLITLIEDVIVGDDVAGNAQTELYYLPPLPATEDIRFTLEQTDGTGRVFDWQILEV